MRYVTIFLIMFVIPAFAQSPWIEQHAVGLPASDNPTLYLATVNSNICWGIQVGVLNPKCVLTVDGGQNWDILFVPGISDLSAGSIAAVDDKTAWIAVDDQLGTNSGIFKTIDGGINWERKGTAFSNGGHPRILYFFDANNGLCIGNPRNYEWEIYITNDAGETWIEIHYSKIPGITAPGDMTFGSISAASGDNFGLVRFGDLFINLLTKDKTGR